MTHRRWLRRRLKNRPDLSVAQTEPSRQREALQKPRRSYVIPAISLVGVVGPFPFVRKIFRASTARPA